MYAYHQGEASDMAQVCYSRLLDQPGQVIDHYIGGFTTVDIAKH